MARERITILVEVDIDPEPGWGHDPDNYVKYIENFLLTAIPHYKPTVKLESETDNPTAVNSNYVRRMIGALRITPCSCTKEIRCERCLIFDELDPNWEQ